MNRLVFLTLAACSSTSSSTALDRPVPANEAPTATPAITVSPRLRDGFRLARGGAPTALDPKLHARFAVLATRDSDKAFFHELVVYRIASGRVDIESRAALPGTDTVVNDIVWRDANELVILLHGGKLLSYRDGMIAPLARPSAAHFKVANPKNGAERVDRDERLVATARGEVWLHHCVWAYIGDENPCVADIHVRVVPEPHASDAVGGTSRVALHTSPAREWTYSIAPSSPGSKTGTLECKGPSGAGSRHLPDAEAQSQGFSVDDIEWLSHRPPIALVHEWVAGMDDAVPVARVFAGCELAKDFEPQILASTREGLWVVDDSPDATGGTPYANAIVLWHGLPIASLPGASQVWFAP